MRLRPPKKEVVGAWVEVYEKQSWRLDRTPKQAADDLAKELEHALSEHVGLKHLGTQVRVSVQLQCPDCGHPYEPNEADAGEGIAGFCAWDGCDLREPEEGPA